MRILLAALIILGGVGSAQQGGGEAGQNPPAGNDAGSPKNSPAVRRLDAVIWDPLQAQLIWLVSVWDLQSNTSEPSDIERYVIHVDSGVMESNGELRRFQVPGADLHALMNLISIYAMRSMIWWEHAGAGEDETPGLAPDGSSGTKDKTKGGDPKDNPKPAGPGKTAGLEQLPAASPHAPLVGAVPGAR